MVDDDLGGPYPPGPSDYVARALGPELVGRYAGGSRVVLAFAEPRAWKGRSGFGPEARDALAHTVPGADLIVLFGHPRLAAELPSEAPVLLAWHRQRLMQEAVARWLRAQAELGPSSGPPRLEPTAGARRRAAPAGRSAGSSARTPTRSASPPDDSAGQLTGQR